MATPVVFDNEAVVIDNGTWQYKVGFAGEDSPRLSVPTVVGLSEGNDLFGDEDKSDCHIGWGALERKENMALRRPLDRGRVTDWEAMEKLWRYTFDHELKSETEHGHLPVLMSVPSKGFRAGRQRIVQTLFESFDLPGVALFSDGLLSLYSTGRVSGLVLEFGEGSLTSVPCFEGHVIPYATARSPLAGADLTALLQKQLELRCGLSLGTEQYEILQDIKERTVFLRSSEGLTPEGVVSGAEGYELPDGRIISIPEDVRSSVPELLFDPSIGVSASEAAPSSAAPPNGTPAALPSTSSTRRGVIDLARYTLERCDNDLRSELSGFVMVSGGTSTIPGLHARVQSELSGSGLFPKSARVHADSQRKNGTWMGGSMIASMDQFRNIMITRQEYDEFGEDIVLRKHF